MPAGLPLTAELVAWIGLFMLIITRLSFVVFLMPGIGEQTVPVRVRLSLLLAIATAFTASSVIALPLVASPSGFLGVMITEAVIGLGLGVLLRLAIWMLSIAGTIIAQVIGLSQMLGIALETEAQTLTANMLAMAGAALLLSADYHVTVIARLADIYSEIPIGSLGAFDPVIVFQSAFKAFNLAVLLAWPFVAINLLYNICLGFINRALPSLMVAFVGAPFMIGAGLLLLTISIVTILTVWQDRIPFIVGWL